MNAMVSHFRAMPLRPSVKCLRRTHGDLDMSTCCGHCLSVNGGPKIWQRDLRKPLSFNNKLDATSLLEKLSHKQQIARLCFKMSQKAE